MGHSLKIAVLSKLDSLSDKKLTGTLNDHQRRRMRADLRLKVRKSPESIWERLHAMANKRFDPSGYSFGNAHGLAFRFAALSIFRFSSAALLTLSASVSGSTAAISAFVGAAFSTRAIPIRTMAVLLSPATWATPSIDSKVKSSSRMENIFGILNPLVGLCAGILASVLRDAIREALRGAVRIIGSVLRRKTCGAKKYFSRGTCDVPLREARLGQGRKAPPVPGFRQEMKKPGRFLRPGSRVVP